MLGLHFHPATNGLQFFYQLARAPHLPVCWSAFLRPRVSLALTCLRFMDFVHSALPPSELTVRPSACRPPALVPATLLALVLFSLAFPLPFLRAGLARSLPFAPPLPSLLGLGPPMLLPPLLLISWRWHLLSGPPGDAAIGVPCLGDCTHTHVALTSISFAARSLLSVPLALLVIA